MSENHQEQGRRGSTGARPSRLAGRRTAGSSDVTTQPVVPLQPAPRHEAVRAATAPAPQAPEPVSEPVSEPRVTGAGIPARAEWTEERRGHLTATLLFTALVLGTLACLGMALATRSPLWAVGLVLCAFVAVVVQGTMISSTHSVVRLEGSNLTIHRGRRVAVFNLADTFRLVETVGTPGDSRWRLRLETAEGRIVELGPHHVDADVMHNAVVFYRSRQQASRAGGPDWWRFRN